MNYFDMGVAAAKGLYKIYFREWVSLTEEEKREVTRGWQSGKNQE